MAINETIENIAIKFNTEDLSLSQSDKIYSIEEECVFDGPYNLSITKNMEEPADMVDFEDLIDTLNSVDKREGIEDINKFENILRTSEDCIHDGDRVEVKENLGLDEINNYFENVINESNSINKESGESTFFKREDNLSNNDNGNKIETQSNDADIFIDLTVDDVDVSSKANKKDIIPITFEEYTESTSSDGYHSSDFEFITESDAELDEYIINFSRNKFCNNDIYHNSKCRGVLSGDVFDRRSTSQIKGLNSKIANPAESSRKYNTQLDMDSKNSSNLSNGPHSSSKDSRNVSDLGEGPSGLNRPLYDYSNRDYRQNHLIPEGEGYLALFRGAYNPILPMSDIILLENKSIRPSPMNIQYEGIGFDKQLIWRKCQQDSSDDEYEDEAKESMEKILFTYPDYNRKPKRKRL
ncbi:unnamed protein product [Arctia plantaginis]|uniref:Uncharacterized protein n=1 Tax=Arctia plantaginis TaxID=874455 RepID=A0A8S1AB05_ARCPL|nr:unnamed protein product [Arctia plantaginis]